MFQSFVTGPIGTGRFGLIRRCVECRTRGATRDARCSGFGSGCLVGNPSDKEVRLGLSREPLRDIEPRLGDF
jgi:hypothetical protein